MKKSCKNFIPRFAIEGFADLEVHCPIGTDQLIGRRPIHQRARHRSPKNGSRTILPQFSDETLEETRKMNLIAVLFKLISLSLSRTRLCAWSPKKGNKLYFLEVGGHVYGRNSPKVVWESVVSAVGLRRIQNLLAEIGSEPS